MKTKNIIIDLIWLSIGLAFFAGGLDLGMGPLNAPGPGFFPIVLGVLLFLLSLLQLIKASLARDELDGKDAFLSQVKISPKVLMSLFALILYMCFLNIFGYILATFLLMFFLLAFVSRKQFRFSISIAILISIITYSLFRVILSIPLPKGFIQVG